MLSMTRIPATLDHPATQPADLRQHLDRLERERDRLFEVLCVLCVLGELSARDLPTEQLLEETVHQVGRLTRASGAVIELVDGSELVYRAAAGALRGHLGQRLARATSLSGRCVEYREVMYAADTATDPRVDQVLCRAVDARSMMVVPLLHGSHAVGVLKVTSGEPAAFDAIDEHALRLSAGIVAGLLARAG